MKPGVKPYLWIIVHVETGTREEILGLNKWCKDRGMNRGNLFKTVTGERSHHKGYKLLRAYKA